MNAIFVPVPGLTEQQLEQLQAANVAYSPFVLGDQSGRLFLDENALFRVLGPPYFSGPDRSSYDGVVIVTFANTSPAIRKKVPRVTVPPPAPLRVAVPADPTPAEVSAPTSRERRVTLPHWYMDEAHLLRRGETEAAMVKVAEEVWVTPLAEGLQIANYWGSSRADIRTPSRGRYGVYLSAGRRLGREVPETLLGVQIPRGIDALAVEPTTPLQVLTDASGFEYAQITGKRIWILLRFGHRGDQWEIDLFREILKEIVKELTITGEDKAAKAKQERQAKIPESRRAYVTACGRRVTKAIDDTKAAVTRQEQEVTRTSETLVRLLREVEGLRRKLPLIESVNAQDVVGYGREFDKIMTLPKVKYVEVVPDGSIFRFYTTTLYCVDPRSKLKHEIGEFKIEMNANTSQVRWYNLTRRVTGMEGGMQAPHVYAAGHACLGNTAEIFPDLIARYEMSVAALIAINFIEAVNVNDSAGRHIDKWPVAGAATPEELAAGSKDVEEDEEGEDVEPMAVVDSGGEDVEDEE